MSDPHVLELGPSDWNSPLDDFLFQNDGCLLVVDTSRDQEAFLRAVTHESDKRNLEMSRSRARKWATKSRSPSSNPPSRQLAVASAAGVHAAADHLLDLVQGLFRGLGVRRPDPARRVLTEADRCDAALAALLSRLQQFGDACNGKLTLKASACARRTVEALLGEIRAAFVVECENPLWAADLIPDWYFERTESHFARYRDHLATTVFPREVPSEWIEAVGVRLSTIASVYPSATWEAIREGLREEREYLHALAGGPRGESDLTGTTDPQDAKSGALLAAAARLGLKLNELRAVEEISRGKSVADLALIFGWTDAGNSWNSLRVRLNAKLRKHGISLSTRNHKPFVNLIIAS